ncbi:helix-turn-helix domain-containing protein [Streptomyces achromogenes]|uniref:helix-turn-helix domain-containing protein n=1 Tax=Streptomyces achromogenes TaxID=67255 RepID=UPI000B2A0B20|nr:helix-turn-helix domain-containing protein [Streptomyces achromogenes]
MERYVEVSTAPVRSLRDVARQLDLSRHEAALFYGQLSKVTGYSKSTLHRALTGKRCPWEVVEAIANACGANVSEIEEAWLSVQGPPSPVPSGPNPNAINTWKDLSSAMQALLTRSGMSLRQLESRAGFGKLPRTTVNEVLRGKRQPREEMLLSFVRTLDGEGELSAWTAAWRRVRASRGAGWIKPHQTMFVTPSPRILSVLGDIDMSEANCLAELVDNFIDACVEDGEPAGETPRISISFEKEAAQRRQDAVVIRDNGPGMDYETLTHAVALSWVGRARKKGLSLGFSMATARLGRHITIRSAKIDSPAWTVVTIDIPSMNRSGKWEVPVVSQEKVESGDHGTEITIRGLREPWRESKGEMLCAHLGDLYSYPIRSGRLAIEVNGRQVSPRRPCIWGENRSVPRRGGDVGAMVKIDVPLSDAALCLDCERLNPLNSIACEYCENSDLVVQRRRVWGWIGVQRYAHSSDYGIDFVRNGRKILRRDKSLFSWRDPESSVAIQEYPLELGNRGRIVGEIHCDHVPVTYKKDDFDRNGNEWQAVVAIVRGEGPLRPILRRRSGYPESSSPLSEIFKGFYRNDPGLKWLTPGDGRRAIHSQTVEWARLFHDGVMEYQSDEVWYRAAQAHDRIATSGGSGWDPHDHVMDG